MHQRNTIANTTFREDGRTKVSWRKINTPPFNEDTSTQKRIITHATAYWTEIQQCFRKKPLQVQTLRIIYYVTW